MVKSSIEKVAHDIGYDIGHSDDHVQADLINGLASGFSKIQKDHDYEMQLCYVTDKLTKESFKMIETLNDFVKLKKEELL